MKKLIVALFLFLIAGITANAQKAKKTVSKPKTKVVKSQTTVNKVELEMLIKHDDGSTTFEKLKTGDKLVYEVNAGGSTYNFIVSLNKANVKDGYDFNYEMTNENKTKGHVKFSFQTLWDSKQYVNYFKGGELTLKDAITVWLSGSNFADMPSKKTDMTLDNNPVETFYRPENDVYEPTILFKGKQVKIDGFFINNAEDGKGDKTICIQNSSSNTLILKMDLGWTIELKEIK
ncbi:MAG: hypothetical protein KA319_00950 [Ferruginibacter sp.]|nr:hypothetical protein [Ferruginibacter sp.]